MGRTALTYNNQCPRCGRTTRPPMTTVHEFPDTIKAADTSGMCCACKRGRTSGRAVRVPMTAAQQAERDERTKRELGAYLAARRARGVDSDGVYFPGDPVPTRAADDVAHRRPVVRGRGVNLKERCIRGHEYPPVKDGRRRRCYTCEKLTDQENRTRAQVGLAA